MSSNKANENNNEKETELKTDISSPNQNDTVLELQLGDVIQISSPNNEVLNDQTYIIDYIDKSKAYLINTSTMEKQRLSISEDGVIGDGNNLLDNKLKNKFFDENKIKNLELKKGEACIFSNYTLHGSDKNTTDKNRLGFTTCYMNAQIKNTKTNKNYPVIFGKNALTQDYVKSLKKIPSKVYELS